MLQTIFFKNLLYSHIKIDVSLWDEFKKGLTLNAKHKINQINFYGYYLVHLILCCPIYLIAWVNNQVLLLYLPM
jgi:hypothetical protein